MKQPPRLQFRLLHSLLLLALFAVWLAVFKMYADTTNMRNELKSYEAFARVLIVHDPSKLKVVEEPEVWGHRIDWQAYVPAPEALEICVQDQSNLGAPEAVASEIFRFALTPGRHRISFRYELPLNSSGPQDLGVYVSIDEVEHMLSRRPSVEGKRRLLFVPRPNPSIAEIVVDPGERVQVLSPSGKYRVPWSIWIEAVRKN